MNVHSFLFGNFKIQFNITHSSTSKRDRRGVYRVLVRRSEGRRTLGKPSRRWDDCTKMYLQRWEREVWTG
jgi:hypothetical protein